jgi:predicted dehydrogenase
VSTGKRLAPVRLAVVGLGYWGPNLVRNFHELPCASLELVCDERAEALHNIAARYPALRTTADFADVLTDSQIEAVAIATPVGTHAELARAALEAGKHVFVEKPLAASSLEGESLIQLANDRERVLMPGHTFLYSPPVNVIRDLIRRGDLGEIYFISSSRVNLGIHQSDVSVIWDLGPHDFSILRYWLDEMPESVSAIGRDSIVEGVPDVAFLTLRFPSGVLVNLEMSWLAPSKLRRTVLVGSERMVVYEDGAGEPVRIYDHGVVYKDPESFGEYHLSYRTGDIVSPRVDGSEPLAILLRDFASSIRSGSAPEGHGELCLDVVRLVETSEASLRDNGAMIPVNGIPAGR